MYRYFGKGKTGVSIYAITRRIH